MLRSSCREGLFHRGIRVFSHRSESTSHALNSRPHFPLINGVRGLAGSKGSSYLHRNGEAASNFSAVPQILGQFGKQVKVSVFPQPAAVNLRSFIHSSSQKEFDTERNSGSMNFGRGIRGGDGKDFMGGSQHSSSPKEFETEGNYRSMNFGRGIIGGDRKDFMGGSQHSSSPKEFETERNSRSMNFVRGIIGRDGRDGMGGSQLAQYGVEHNADIVHIKLMRNNTFVTVTDSKGNKKIGASSGMLSEMKGGPKVSRYAAEATAEYVGRLARTMGLKSFVVKVNGFTYFKKKKLAIVSFREGFTHSRSDQNPIMYIEDTTRKAHNGCRLPKKRRV